MLTVCICTHNPKEQLFIEVLSALAGQVSSAVFDVLIIDNASTPPIPDDVLTPLSSAGLTARIVREAKPGLVHARLRAIAEFSGTWMLCVDDDNIISPGYVAEGLTFVGANPHVGAFGGKLLLPPDLHVPAAASPFLPYLAIKDLGNAPLGGVSDKWEVWEPPAAGAFVARSVLEHFAHFVLQTPLATSLGRAPGDFASCEDALLMRSAYRLGLATAYNPRLRLTHCIDPTRLELPNLIRLLEAYGRSHATLSFLLRGSRAPPFYYRNALSTAATMTFAALRHLPAPIFGYARARYHWAASRAYRNLACTQA